MTTHDEGRHFNCMLQIITDMSEDGNRLNQRLFTQQRLKWVLKVRSHGWLHWYSMYSVQVLDNIAQQIRMLLHYSPCQLKNITLVCK